MTKKFWSDEELAKLRELYPNKTTLEVAKSLNRSVCSINGMAFSLGLKKSEKHFKEGNSGRIRKGERIGIKTQFKKGSKPVNAGKKWDEFMAKEAQEKARKTTFKPGRLPHNTKQDGMITVRTDNRNVNFQWIRIGLSKWIPLHHHVWIQANGKIPKGHVLAFIDKNPMNATLDNIILITKADNCRRNSIARIPLEVRQTMTVLKKLKKEIEKHTK